MKLFLSSIGINNPSELYKLLGKSSNIKTALISNAFELKPPEDRKARYDLVTKNLSKLNLELTDIDLKKYSGNPDALKKELLNYDFIWVTGGNVFYLRMLMQESGLDKILKELVDSGIAYGGDSAGAIVIGPTLCGFERADHIGEVKKVIYAGSGLINFVPLPHWGTEKFQGTLNKIKEDLIKQGLSYEIMTDDAAIVVDGEVRKLI